nr:methylmalonyl-CoA mutase family protein [Streptomyces sp. REN17]
MEQPKAAPSPPGAHPSLYAGRPWTAGRCTGFGTAPESNARYRRLFDGGATTLSVTFDPPARTGHDSDAPVAPDETGGAGVTVDSLDDMRVLFAGIPLDRVSTSMTAHASAAPLLLLYQLAGEEQGVPARRLAGTIRRDVCEEYLAQGTCTFPPRSSLRLVTDILEYCRAEMPGWSALSLSGHRMAEAGASAAQEAAFMLADGIEYVRAAVSAGWDVDDVAPRLSFLFAARASSAGESAAFRAAQRIWARVMREEFGARGPASLVLRHPRAAAGGPPAPRRRPAREATGDVGAAIGELLARVEELGGAAGAVEAGFQRGEMERSAHRTTRQAGAGGRAGAGADRAPLGGEGHGGEGHGGEPHVFLCTDPDAGTRRAERTAKLRAWRCHERVGAALTGMQKAAAGTGNVLYPMKDALAAGATVGEVRDALHGVWGTRVPRDGT